MFRGEGVPVYIWEGVRWKWRRSIFFKVFHYVFYLAVKGKADSVDEGHAYVLVVAEA